jgi:hypothetical protein
MNNASVKITQVFALFAAILAVAVPCLPARAQNMLPDGPVPQIEIAQSGQPESDASIPGESSSSAQSLRPGPSEPPAIQPGAEQKNQHDTAAEQIRAQQKQRIMFIMPNFNTSYINDAATLSGSQKMRLAFRSAIDPFAFAGPLVVASFDVGLNDDPVFGPGAKGFFQHAGAAYVDAFDGMIIGNGLLPWVLHQDPRYFRRGYGSFTHRELYAIATSFICKHDNSGRWEPNYSNIGGNFAAGAISTLYYPDDESGFGRVAANAMIVTAEGTIMGSINEFWPDISRKLFHKDPTNGRDAQTAAADKADKAGRKHPIEPNPK